MPTETISRVLGRVVILSGAVGSGKSTVAKYLLPLLPEPTCYIDGDMFWAIIVKPGKRDRRENFYVIMRAMTAACIPFARAGFTVLLDFSIPPDFLRTARIILKEIQFDYVVLDPGLAECARRAGERTEGRIEDYTALEGFHGLFEGAENAIDDKTATPQELAARIYAGLIMEKFVVKDSNQ